ncbi:MAG: ferritin-like domain-containing protein [Ilumatobacteraceae bacterium]
MDSPASSTDGGLRRRLIGAGMLGLAGALLPSLASQAGASTPPDASTTTTAPPKRPTSDDATSLAFVREIELAAVELYNTALRGDAITDELRPTFEFIRQSHLSYGQSLGALLGQPAPPEPLARVVKALSAAFSGSDLMTLAAAAAELENIAVATHTEMLGELVGIDGANLIASILIVESRNATVLSSIAGETDLDALLLDNAEPLTAEKG